MAVTNGLSLPIPELTESADGPDAFGDLANAVEDYVLDRILPAGVTHYMPHHWGSGTSYPTLTGGVKSGDLYYHSGLACTMRCITPGNTTGTNIWRQAEEAIVSNASALAAISTNYAALLYEGFKVRINQQTGPPIVASTVYFWAATGAWVEGPAFDIPVFRGLGQSQTILPNTWTALQFASLAHDTHAMSAVSATSATIKKAGYYQIGLGWHTNNFSTGRRICSVRKNGVEIYVGGTVAFQSGDGSDLGVSATGTALFAVNDVVQAMMYQDSAGNITTSPAAFAPSYLNLTFLRPA